MRPIQIYADIDENGQMINTLLGRDIIPDRQYDIFIMTEDQSVLEHPQNLELVGYNGQKCSDLAVKVSAK